MWLLAVGVSWLNHGLKVTHCHSLVYLPGWVLCLLMGRKARIYDLVWISKEEWRDLGIISYLGRMVVMEETAVGRGRREKVRKWTVRSI